MNDLLFSKTSGTDSSRNLTNTAGDLKTKILNNPLSVSALLAYIQDMLSEHFSAEIKVKGEVSDFKASISGHWYFLIKDKDAQLQCVMFKHNHRFFMPQPKDGDLLIFTGIPGFYKTRGQFQFIVSSLTKAGEGDALRKLEVLKQKLKKEGMFDLRHKKELPKIIHHLCIITSPNGAALQDVLKVVNRRMPMMRLYIAPALVQGEEAAPQIIEMLRLANAINKFDAVLITRGGGSAEDINCFNNEKLVRAIFSSKIPVVSAVGHEIDFTLCDLVADHRSPTPSAAAEELSIDSEEIVNHLRKTKNNMKYSLENRANGYMQKMDDTWLRMQISNPIDRYIKQLQTYEKNLGYFIHYYLQGLMNSLMGYRSQLAENSPLQKRSQSMAQLNSLMLSLSHNMHSILNRKENFVQNNYLGLRSAHSKYYARLEAELQKTSLLFNALNPKSILNRGYSLVRDAQGRLLSDVSTLNREDLLNIQMAKGNLTSKIMEINPSDDAVT